MERDLDPRDDKRERPGLHRSGRGAAGDHDVRRQNPREVLVQDLDLPRGRARERVRVHTRTYGLRGSEVRALATVGAFRVVPAEDLREATGRTTTARTGDLYRLREAGLVRTIPYGAGRDRTTLVVLTEEGRELLETHRRPADGPRQTFYAGLVKPREVPHDSHVYRAYLRSADRLVSSGSRIRRVVLDYELKRDYQRFLQDRNRRHRHPNADEWVHFRNAEEWARGHHLPYDDGHVQFPDVRIEFERPDGRFEVEDVEVWTPHYRGAFAQAKAAAGFARYRSGGRGVIGSRSGRRGGASLDPRLAEELLP